MRKADFIPNLVTGLILILTAVFIQVYYPVNIGSVIAFLIIGITYLCIAYFQFNNKS